MSNPTSVPRRRWLSAGLLSAGLLSVTLLAGCFTGVPQGAVPVKPFDLQRYLGTWYEIARLDHSFERGLTDVNATYALKDDGSVSVLNRGFDPAKGAWKEAEGRALFIGDPQTASLKVSFFGPFFGGYHVIALDPDYRWAMVIGPDTGYLWILARDKTLDTAVREKLVAQAASLGVDTRGLIWVEHGRAPR
ncbi:MAG: lipocalin [Comamonadaceae bacterium]|jgi:apolipoprotein D and lipocalin family protein|nr:lipocalin [Comamonadaceae bacterium]